MSFYEQIIKIKKERKLDYTEMGSVIGKSADAFRMGLKRKSFSELEIEKLTSVFLNEQKFADIEVSEQSEVFTTKSGNVIEELSGGKYLLSVHMVPYKAQGRYVSEYTDAEFIDDLTRVSFIVDKVPRGKYLAWEITNDSMNDATPDSEPSRSAILNGDVVLGREVSKQHWQNELNFNGYRFWIIVHKDTILCKEIINHDLEKGTITCHSLNNSPEYKDFDLDLNDCHQLFNIIKKQI